MTELFLESGFTSLNKAGEEACGDRVECLASGGWTTLVLADGLGSGIKANILATLTSKILCGMISGGAALEECVATVSQTLPVCKTRGIAYSTFSCVRVNHEGRGFLFEFDNPGAIHLRGGKCADFDRVSRDYFGKRVYTTALNLLPGDYVVLMSDGAVHAGVGKVFNLGWSRRAIMAYLDERVRNGMSARAVACLLAGACNDLYVEEPGDDTTVAAVRVREKVPVSVMVGPPVDSGQDDFHVGRFLAAPGKKIVCGGTSARIVARRLGRGVATSVEFPDRDVPPIGYIDGIDLATEGVLTLRKLLALSERYKSERDLSPKVFNGRDGASLLAQTLLEEATHVCFFVGMRVNPAHQGLPIDRTMKMKLVEALARTLHEIGKVVEIHYD